MSKIGNFLIGVVGGVIGYIVGGPYGAWIGFGLAYGVANIIDPMVPDMPSPGEPMSDLEMMTSIEGSPIPEILGTTKLTGNLFWFGNNYMIETTEEVDSGGMSGGSSQTVVTGQRWYLSWALGFCMGEMDNLYSVYLDDKIMWGGDIAIASATNGMIRIALVEGGGPVLDSYGNPYEEGGEVPGFTGKIMQPGEGFIGFMNFYFGTADQVIDTELTTLMIEEGTIPDSTWAIPYRRQSWAFLDDIYVGGYNRCPTVKVVMRNAPECSFDP